MAEHLVVRGLIATDPRLIETETGLSVLSFRLAAPQRRFDSESAKWISDQTNWFSVSSFRKLAENSPRLPCKGRPGRRLRQAQGSRLGQRRAKRHLGGA